MARSGGLDLPEALLSSELRIMVLERVVELLVAEQAKSGIKLSLDLEAINRESLKKLREKYPALTIESEDEI